jgi:hypothetical protein
LNHHQLILQVEEHIYKIFLFLIFFSYIFKNSLSSRDPFPLYILDSNGYTRFLFKFEKRLSNFIYLIAALFSQFWADDEMELHRYETQIISLLLIIFHFPTQRDIVFY